MPRKIRSTRLDILYSIFLLFYLPDQTLNESVILRIRESVTEQLKAYSYSTVAGGLGVKS